MQTSHNDAASEKGHAVAAIETAGFAHTDEEVKAAATSQKDMTLVDGLRKYPKAAAWSALLSTTIVMVAYDTILLNSFYAFPSFQTKYGRLVGKKHQIPAKWQSGLSDGSNVGGIIGLFISGYLSDLFGHKNVMLGALVAIMGFIFIPFFAPNLAVLEVGEILCGVVWGVCQALATPYASEVSPVVLRHYLTSYINICWVFGHFLGAGVLRALLQRHDKWAYKIPFAIQWAWPVPLFVGILFAPQSPWWLVRKGRHSEAKHTLRRLTSAANESDLDATLALMVKTDALERDIQCVVMAYVIQYLHGNGLAGYSTYFFEQAGLDPANAFNLTMGQYAIGFVATVISWFLMSRFGRRTLYLTGMVLSCVLLFTIAFIALVPPSNRAANWATGAFLLAFFAVHSTFIGPVLYTIVGEIPSTRLRQKSIVIAASAWSIMGLVNASLTPYMLNPTAWNWRGKAGFFWGGLSILSLVWTWFRLPEAQGRTFAELDVLFVEKIPARKFKNTKVDVGSGRVLRDDSARKHWFEVKLRSRSK